MQGCDRQRAHLRAPELKELKCAIRDGALGHTDSAITCRKQLFRRDSPGVSACRLAQQRLG